MNSSQGKGVGVVAIVISILGLLVAVFTWQRGETQFDISQIEDGSLPLSVFKDSYPIALEFTEDELTGATLWFSFDRGKLVKGEVLGEQTEREPELPTEEEGEAAEEENLNTTPVTNFFGGSTTVVNNLALNQDSVGTVEIIDGSVRENDLGFASVGSNQLRLNAVGNWAIQPSSITGDKINPFTDLTVGSARTRTLNSGGVFFVDNTGSAGPNGEVVSIIGDLYVSGTIDPTDIILEPIALGAVAVDVRDISGARSVFTANESGDVTNAGDTTTEGDVNVGSNLDVEGDSVLGSDLSDALTVNALVASDFTPSVDNVYDLGTEENRWRSLFAALVNVDALTAETLLVTADSLLQGDLEVEGVTTLNSMLDVAGATYLGDTLEVEGAVTLNDELSVAGVTTLGDDLIVWGESFHHSPEHYYADVDFGDGTNIFLAIDSSNGYLSNPASGTVTIDDQLAVQESLMVMGQLFQYGESNFFDDIQVGDGTTVFLMIDSANGYLSNPNGRITVDDRLDVTGRAVFSDTLGSDTGPLVVADNQGLLVERNDIGIDLFLVDGVGNAGNRRNYYVGRDLGVARDSILGDSPADLLVVNARVMSDFVPVTTETYDLGSSALRWADTYTTLLDVNTLRVNAESFHYGPEHYFADVDFGDGTDQFLRVASVDGTLTNPTTGVVRVDDRLVVTESLGSGGAGALVVADNDGLRVERNSDGTDLLWVDGDGFAGNRRSYSVGRDLAVARDASIDRDLTVVGSTTLGLTPADLLQVESRSVFNGFAVFNADMEIYEDLMVNQDLLVGRDVDITGALDVTGNSYVTNLFISGLMQNGTNADGNYVTIDDRLLVTDSIGSGDGDPVVIKDTQGLLVERNDGTDLFAVASNGDATVNRDLEVGRDVDAGVLLVNNAASNGPESGVSATVYEVSIAGDLEVTGVIDPVGILLEPMSDGDVAIQVNNTASAPVFTVDENGAVLIGGTLDLGGGLNVTGNLDVDGDTTLDLLDVAEAATLSSTLGVTGDVAFSGNLTVDGNAILGNANTDEVKIRGIIKSGDAQPVVIEDDQGLRVKRDGGLTDFTVDGNGNVDMQGTLSDSNDGEVDVVGTLDVQGKVQNSLAANPFTVKDGHGFEVENNTTGTAVFHVADDGSITIAGGATYNAGSGTLSATTVTATTIQGTDGVFGQVDTSDASKTNSFAGPVDAQKGLAVSGETLTVGANFTVTQVGAITAASFTNGTILISGGALSGVTTLGVTTVNATTVTATGTITADTLTPTGTLNLSGGVTVTGSPNFTGSPTVATSPIVTNATFGTEFAKRFVSGVETVSSGSGTVGANPYLSFTIDVGAGETMKSVTATAIGTDNVRAALIASPVGNQTATVRVFYPGTSLPAVVTGITWTAELQ